MSSDEVMKREIDLLKREIELLKRENDLKEREKCHEETSKEVNDVSIRDIEDTLPEFGDNSKYPVEDWLKTLEENAELYNWSEAKLLICAKRLLTKTAKLWLNSTITIKTWKLFKSAIIEEFGQRFNSATVHQELSKRKKMKEESFQEYILVMTTIARQANIEDESIIQYIIDGIQDYETNKAILYGVSTLKELKSKIDLYAKMKSKLPTTERKTATPENKNKPKETCFICNKAGHKAKECRHKSKGTKCYSCNEFGHIATRCPKKRSESNSEKPETETPNDSMQVQTHKENKMYKEIKINDSIINVLVDTGSCLNLIRSDEYFRIGAPKIDSTEIKRLTGLGNIEISTYGSFQAKIEIDNFVTITTMHVVDTTAMNMKCLIGNEVLDKFSLIIGPNGIQFQKFDHGDNVMITAVDEAEEYDLHHIENIKHREVIKNLIKNYSPKATKVTNVSAKIILKDETPIYQTPRRLSPQDKKEVDKQIDDWLKKGIIRPSSSEFSSPIVLVKKKNGSIRICIDYRKLNKEVVKDRYLLPIIEDQLDKLQGAKMFSSIDLKNGFFHVPMSENSSKYTAFVTPNGQYEFLKMPFGFCNAPSIFQRFINDIFRQLIHQGIVVPYLDDMICVAKDENEALNRLKQVLQVASEHGLSINWEKCQFLRKNITYLGYEIEEGQIRPDMSKIKAVDKFPEPTTVKQVQSFLGLTGYFRKFVENYSLIAKPLSDMLKKSHGFKFEEKEKQAFQLLKKKLSERPVLNIYNQNSETELHTDASKYGLGAILLQKNSEDDQLHPVYFYSKKNNETEQKYSSYELEVLAVITALKKFRVYLQGIKFKIVTDCSAFQMTMSKKELTTRIARWALMLEDFDYTVEHREGSRMRHVDALSRYPIMMLEDESLTFRIKKLQEKDDEIRNIQQQIKNKETSEYLMKNNLLYKYQEGRELIYVPKGLRIEILRRIHEMGHFGEKKMREMVQREYYLPKLEKTINNVIQNCVHCILHNRKIGKQEGFLNPINKSGGPLDTIHIDHVGSFPSTNKNYKYLPVLIDSFTKFTWIFPTKSTGTQEVLDKLSLHQSIFGNPRRIITDRGTAFTSQDFQEYCKCQNIECIQITTGVPRGNGQVERIHQVIIAALSKLSHGNPNQWFKFISSVQRYINCTYQRSIDTTPFELMIGVGMRNKEDIRLSEIIEEKNQKVFCDDRKKTKRRSQKKNVNCPRRKPQNL